MQLSCLFPCSLSISEKKSNVVSSRVKNFLAAKILGEFLAEIHRGAASQSRIFPTVPCDKSVLPSGVKARKLV